MEGIQLLTPELIAAVAEGARKRERRRLNHNFHSGPADNPHRFLNVLLRGTYIRPHRHLDPPKAEAFLVLEGEAGIVIFDEAGAATGVYRLARTGATGIDIAAGIWHTVIALSDCAVCYEVKPGPWDPTNDKDFATWAPAEGDARTAELVRQWESLF